MGLSKEYRFKADTYAPELKPRPNPDDLKKIKSLYSDLESRFTGLESELKDCKIEQLVITITKRGGIADNDL